jgi:hypothetical protein
MAPIQQLTRKRAECLLYWSVVEHHRWWISFDGPIWKRVNDVATPLNGCDVLLIALQYSVFNDIVLKPTPPESIAKGIRDLAKVWPDTLECRAESCIATANTLAQNGHTRGSQRSMVTKLIWFLKPNNWTMFDKNARLAFGIRDRTETGMKRFYRELENWGFSEQAREISETLNGAALSELFGERVLDKLLWLLGAEKDTCRNAIERCEAFLNTLDDSHRRELTAAAKAVSRRHAVAIVPSN